MAEEMPASEVIEIHPDAKYFLVVKTEGGTPEEVLEKLELVARNLDAWWKSKNPFMIINSSGFKLVRVDEVEDDSN
jgi:hypothetical protein